MPGMGGLAAYSALSLSLAMAMLPVYMIAPKFYGDTLGVGLGVLGVALFAVRLIDTVQDPLIGRLVDWLGHVHQGWRGLLVIGAILLAFGFVLLFHVPGGLGESSVVLWMVVSLVIVYTAHSLMNVCYLSWGARLTDDTAGRARVSAWREAFGVVGVVIASIVPALWATSQGSEQAYAGFAWVFVITLAITVMITLTGSPDPHQASARDAHATQVSMHTQGHRSRDVSRDVSQGRLARWLTPWRMALGRDAVGEGRWLWRLYAFYLCNATAAALPATLILFYVEDVIERPAQTGLFLGAYFAAGLATLGIWVRVSDRLGKYRAWGIGSLISGAGLCLAAFLGAGNTTAYLFVCILTGCALGVDLALPAAMLADAIQPEQRASTGIYFGIWAFIAKFALAVSAGVSLPLLSVLGYQPGEPSSATALAWVYAFMPIVFKLVAAIFLGSALLTPVTDSSIQTRTEQGRAKA